MIKTHLRLESGSNHIEKCYKITTTYYILVYIACPYYPVHHRHSLSFCPSGHRIHLPSFAKMLTKKKLTPKKQPKKKYLSKNPSVSFFLVVTWCSPARVGQMSDNSLARQAQRLTPRHPALPATRKENRRAARPPYKATRSRTAPQRRRWLVASRPTLSTTKRSANVLYACLPGTSACASNYCLLSSLRINNRPRACCP